METLYLIECDYGVLGRNFLETSVENFPSRDALICDLASGQIEDAVRILEVIPDEGTCRDITLDIAETMLHLVFRHRAGVCDGAWAIAAMASSDFDRDINESREFHTSIQDALAQYADELSRPAPARMEASR